MMALHGGHNRFGGTGRAKQNCRDGAGKDARRVERYEKQQGRYRCKNIGDRQEQGDTGGRIEAGQGTEHEPHDRAQHDEREGVD